MTDDEDQAVTDEARRDRSIWMTLVFVGILVATGVIALGWGVIDGRLTAAKQLDRAESLLKGTDATIIAADKVIRADVGADTAAKAFEIAPHVEIARTQIAEANTLAGGSFDGLAEGEQNRARLVQAASEARFGVLDAAVAALSAAERAATAEGLVSQAWAEVLAANALAPRSVADYRTATRVDVKNAMTAAGEAKVSLATAHDFFSQADLLFPEAKLNAFGVYVGERLVLVDLLEQAHAAWLAGRIAQANQLRALYDKMNDDAVQAAQDLPGSPATAVTEAYKTLVITPTSVYQKAWQNAAEADAALRT